MVEVGGAVAGPFAVRGPVPVVIFLRGGAGGVGQGHLTVGDLTEGRHGLVGRPVPRPVRHSVSHLI